MPETMRDGEIILLYKKADPSDIRNYRPITLLNVDYKILAKVVVEGFKPIIDHLISSAQNGFCPGRSIFANIHLCNLIQSYLNDTDDEGLLIFLGLNGAHHKQAVPSV